MTLDDPPFQADILVIDDTPENLALLNTLLTDHGYKVRCVAEGVVGIRDAQALPPDLILLDVHMPQLSGYKVCEQLKADPRTRDIPVIFISALGELQDKIQAFAVGGVDYITKPFRIAEVLARIQTHLSIGQLQQELQAQNQQLRAEIRHREQIEQTFKTIFQSSLNPMALATLPGGNLIQVNPSFLRLSHLESADVLHRPLTHLFWGSNREQLLRMLDTLAETQVPQLQALTFHSPGAPSRYLLISMETIQIHQSPAVLLIVNDLTERRYLENEFISLVSHELRTPLTSLMGSLDLLNSGRLGTLNSSGQHILAIATSSTERLIRLINDILDLERIQAGEIVMNFQACTTIYLCGQVLEGLQPLIDQAQIKMQTQVQDHSFWVDPDRLIQTLTNLLSNAIKFSPVGSAIELHLERLRSQDCRNQWSLLGPLETEWCFLIQVRDQGRGIPADKIQTIFDRFQQVDTSDSRQKGGTGLGLAICQSIVQQHRGYIWAESQVGVGSCFYIILPDSLPPAV